MPKSKKRKKNGKTVGNGEKTRLERFANMESGVSLQDLINVVAYQEYVASGEIVPREGDAFADDIKIDIPEELPVTIEENGEQVRIGTASAIPGDPESISIMIDGEHKDKIGFVDDKPNFSIGHYSLKYGEDNHGKH